MNEAAACSLRRRRLRRAMAEQRPSVGRPVLRAARSFAARRISLLRLHPRSGSGAAKYIETNWGFYRGFRQTDGSVFVQRGRPPARPRQACNDSLFPGSPFSMTGNPHPFQTPSTGGPPLPLIGSSTPNSPGNTIRIFGFDGPDDSYDLTRTNATAKNAINTLFEAQLDFLFCTALIGRNSAGDLRFLKHFYWNVRRQMQLNPAPIAGGIPTPNPPGKGNGTNVGPIIDGEPTDGRFLPLFKYPQSTNCNTLAGNAGAAILKPGSPKFQGAQRLVAGRRAPVTVSSLLRGSCRHAGLRILLRCRRRHRFDTPMAQARAPYRDASIRRSIVAHNRHARLSANRNRGEQQHRSQ